VWASWFDIPTPIMTTTNGKRRPPRPAIELIAPAATAEEAAAIAAALERFLHDTAPIAAVAPPLFSAWARAALLEGVGLEGPNPWG
jgi:hypothetical protein